MSTLFKTASHPPRLTPLFRQRPLTFQSPLRSPSHPSYRTGQTASFRTSSTSSTRPTPRLTLGGLTATGAVLALFHHHVHQPMKLDAWAPGQQSRSFAQQQQQEQRRKEGFLEGTVVRELSAGSVSGFIAGLLVSVFSKTLVLLAGIGMVVFQVAARSGIDLVAYFQLKEKAKVSRILAMLNQHTAFKLSFGIAFALSAFMSF